MTEMVPVKSSNIEAIGYDAKPKLIVRFKNGGTYIYEGVPADKQDELMKAKSIGGYLATNIKGVYPFTKAPTMALDEIEKSVHAQLGVLRTIKANLEDNQSQLSGDYILLESVGKELLRQINTVLK